ncbi:MAG: hypothetical protein COA78_24805 [Blastopirellula sp.]|nr:MAG: hypothetical protein COA78_24805 [Blastopirellula sp.]
MKKKKKVTEAALKRLSLKRAAELLSLDRQTIVDLVADGAPRNANGTLNLFHLQAWLITKTKGGANG